jgi:hypothetical protein
MTVVAAYPDTLRRVDDMLERLSDKRRWCKGRTAMADNGLSCNMYDPEAVAWDLAAADVLAGGDGFMSDLPGVDYYVKARGFRSLTQFNDAVAHIQVVMFLRTVRKLVVGDAVL